MKGINLPRHVIESAEQRWAGTLMREAVAWKEKTPRSMRTAVTNGRRPIPAELRSRSSFAVA